LILKSKVTVHFFIKVYLWMVDLSILEMLHKA
jgi:hypothetical protein